MPIVKVNQIRPELKALYLAGRRANGDTNQDWDTRIIEPPDWVDAIAQADPQFKELLGLRFVPDDVFIAQYGSDYLKHAKATGIGCRDLCLAERVRFVFGRPFECLPSTQVMKGRQIAIEGYDQVAEATSLINKLRVHSFLGDTYDPCFLDASYRDGTKKLGFGVIVKETSAHFIPRGYVVFVIITEYDGTDHSWKPVVNPF